MLDMIEPTETMLTVIVAGIVFWVLIIRIVLKIGIGPYPSRFYSIKYFRKIIE
jgi:hypothetical protein